MKKLLTLFLLTLAVQEVFSQAVTYSNAASSPFYTQGTVRGLYERKDKKILVINVTPNNVGNSSSIYLVTLDPCTGIQTPVTVVDVNLATSTNACFFGFAESTQRTDTSWVYCNTISSSTGKNCCFATCDVSENTYTLSTMFEFTGPNRMNASFSGATFMPNGHILVWNNAHLSTPIEVNDVAIDWVAELDPSAGTVVSRGDLRPYLASPLTGTPAIKTISITSKNEIIILGYFNRLGGITMAQKGAILNPVANILTDLAIDNDAFVFCSQYKEIDGIGYFGYTNQTPPVGLSSGLVRFNPTTYALSACGGVGFGINPQDMTITKTNKLRIAGTRRTIPAGGTFVEYDPIGNTFTDLSFGLFTTPGPSSSITYLATSRAECSSCTIMAGNFSSSFPSGTPRASTFTDLAKACPTGVLAAGPELKVVSKNPPTLAWTNVNDGTLERSSDGRNFISIHTILSSEQRYSDQRMTGTMYYRIKTNNTYSNVVVLKQETMNSIVSIEGNFIVIDFHEPTNATVYNMSGQRIGTYSGTIIRIQRRSQLLIVKTDKEVIKVF